MNILELAEQVGAMDWSPPPMRAVKGKAFTYEALTAFAERIKEECAKVCDAKRNWYEAKRYETYSEWQARGAEYCADDIRNLEITK